MNNTLAEEKQVCSCGRSHSHCKLCGSKNVYVKKTRSFEVTDQLGKRVYVFGCRRCMRESLSEGQECKAIPVRDFNPEFSTEIKPVKAHTRPWGSLIPNTEPYLNFFVETAVEIQKKKHIPLQKAYLELLRLGWPLAEENMDDDLKKAAQDAGLLNTDDANSQPKEAPMRGDSKENPPAPPAEHSLEDIIKAMNEEQK